ncbi:hypothetical protein [Pseudomonas sp.]|uniref:hypothetical protein n=1 Tax=Pseudomonas sp. TaxID=306 RepID=UPI003D0E3DD1
MKRHKVNRAWQAYRESPWGVPPTMAPIRVPAILWLLFAAAGWTAALDFQLSRHLEAGLAVVQLHR